jgi:hypothetical protein
MTIKRIFFVGTLFVLFLLTYIRYYHVPKRDGYSFFFSIFLVSSYAPYSYC